MAARIADQITFHGTEASTSTSPVATMAGSDIAGSDQTAWGMTGYAQGKAATGVIPCSK